MWYLIHRRDGKIVNKTPYKDEQLAIDLCDMMNSIYGQDLGNSTWYSVEWENDPPPPSMWRRIIAFFTGSKP